MFQLSLSEVDKLFPNLSSELTFDQWKERQQIFLDIFLEDIRPLTDLCFKKPFNAIPNYSKMEYLSWGPNTIKIIQFRIRPKENYYNALQKLIPKPDNPMGPHATGIELSIEVNSSIKSDNVFYPPYVIIKFKIWGHEERIGFKLFFKNYRRPLEILLENLGLELFTACCFKNIDKYKGSDIIKKIELYLSNRNDDENNFSIEKSFNRNAESDNILKVFRNLLVLYDCCFGYCKKDKELDRFLGLFETCLLN